MEFNTTNLTLNATASFRDLGEEGIILMAETGQLYSTNESGSAFIKIVQQGATFAAAVDAIQQEFDVVRPTLESDLAELASYLIDEGVLVADVN